MSAHYLVGLDGRVAQFVDEEDTARHAGRVADPTTPLHTGDDPNLHTIGIEFEDGGDPLGVERPAASTGPARGWCARSRCAGTSRWTATTSSATASCSPHKDCPGNLDLERVVRARAAAVRGVPAAGPQRRGGPAGLPRLGRRPSCDAVVALDDGSTDRTGELLRASPLVEILLENPRRESYEGWDDAENRQRLLDAAAELEPDWIVSLDADERIDAERRRRPARRSWQPTPYRPARTASSTSASGPDDRYDSRSTWVYRVFAWRPGQRFPEQRLHFNPIPTDVPRSAWIRTTVRLRHLGAGSEEQLEQRLSKYREADPDRRWPTDFGRLSTRPRGDLPSWRPRPGDLPVLEGGPGGRGAARSSACCPPATPRPTCRAGSSRPAGSRTPWWPSTTGARIAPASCSPPSRSCRCCSRTPAGTRTRAGTTPTNRQRLLDAAAELEPGWIVSLDADERIDAADAAALRDFVETGARPDMAYGFRVFRMVGDLDHYDQAGLWAYRLFAYAPGQRFPQDRLHFVPVPTAIDRRRFLNTTLRIQHLGGLTEERREARFAKYAEADPGNEFQADYTNLLSAAHGSEPLGAATRRAAGRTGAGAARPRRPGAVGHRDLA